MRERVTAASDGLVADGEDMARQVERERGRLHDFPRRLSVVAGNEAPRPGDFLYGVRKLDYHPSPVDPRMPPAVTLLPSEEVRELRKTIVARYLRQLRHGCLARIGSKLRRAEVAAVSDREYVEFLTQTAFAKLLSSRLTQQDLKRFGIDGEVPGQNYAFDFSGLGDIEPLDGLYLCGGAALLSKGPRGEFQPGAIRLDDALLRPGDGDAWEMAKYYVLSSGAFSLLLAEHPMVHFPMDAVNAVAKAVFPAQHRVLQLLLPHAYLQLPLDFAVLYQQRSVVHNSPREMYTVFPHRHLQDVYRLIADRYSGSDGAAAGRFRYPLQERVQLTEYDRFLNEYFRVILDFVSQAVADVPRNDPYVAQWARALAPTVFGFPDERAIGEGNNLARAVAGFIWNCSVVHSVDHHTFSGIPVEKLPLRIRVAPPASRGFVLDRRKIATADDLFRQRLSRRMFFKPHTLTRLIEVDYRFDAGPLQSLNRQFIERLVQLDRSLPRRFMPVQQMAASIQY